MTEKVAEIKDLHFSYPDGTKALNGVNLDIYTDEKLGVIGPNGAGKSTLLFHLNGIFKGEGFIRVFGYRMEDKNLSAIRKRVGIVFQDPDNQLFMPTVFDDVAFGPVNMGLTKEKVRAVSQEALKEVEMLHTAERAPHHLSFGEKKRVSIATVLSMSPDLIALDEPTANLDPRGRADLIQILKNIQKTIVIASHDLDMIREICSRIIILDKGKLIADGKTGAILSNTPLLKKHHLLTLF